jgi:hypothetical protein
MTTQPKPFVFVLMPFDGAFNDVYRIGIKETCEKVGAYCERVDEQHYEGRILDRIYNQIAKADIIVADMTGRNANVFYEVGYAHAIGKRNVILVTRHADDIPFDLKDFPHIVYGEQLTELRDKLEAKLRYCIDNPASQLAASDSDLQLYCGGYRIADGWPLRMHVDFKSGGAYFADVDIDVHNPLPIPHNSDFAIGLAVPDDLSFEASESFVELPNSKRMCIRPNINAMYPDCWARFSFRVVSANEFFAAYNGKLILFTPASKREWKVSLNMHK